MPGAATLSEQMKGRAATAEEVNELLRAIAAEVANTYHVWFRRDDFALVPVLSRRKAVSTGALEDWDRALYVLRLLPYRLRHDHWETDADSIRLLHELAAHPADAVRVPAAVALGMLSQVPPAATILAIMAHRDLVDLHVYAQGCDRPSWWVRPCVHYRAVRWERLCGDIARAVYGAENVLTQFDGETLCADNLVPDIIVGAVERDRRTGRVIRAETIIDAKSGQLPRRHTYCHRCDRLEYWHAGMNGQWVVRRHADDPPCDIAYLNMLAVADLAPTEDLRQTARDFYGKESQFSLYLRFLLDCALAGVGAEDLERMGALGNGAEEDAGDAAN